MLDPSKIAVLVIGDIMLDRYVYGEVSRVSPEEPTCLVLDHVPPVERRAGGAANVALNLAAMGARVHLVGLGGNGRSMQQFVATLDSQLSELRGRRLTHSIGDLYVHLAKGDRPFTVKTRYVHKMRQLLRVDHESRIPLSDEETEHLVEETERALYHDDTPQIVILSDYAKGVLTGRFLSRLVQIERRLLADLPLIVDPKRDDFCDYGRTDVICPNEHEIKRHPMHCCARHVIVTRGINGCELWSHPEFKKKEISSPAPVEICDSTGAGDAFVSAAALGYAAKLPMIDVCWLANLAGRCAVLKQGTVTVTWSDIQVALKNFGMEPIVKVGGRG